MTARKRAGRKKATKRKTIPKKAALRKAPKKKAARKKSARRLPQALIDNQFQPGQSGNPKGRPKRASLEELVRKYLDGKIDPGDGEEEITRLEAMAKIIFSEAVTKRNVKLMIAVMDRLWPKTLRLSEDPENPIGGHHREPDLSGLSDKEIEQMIAIRAKIASGRTSE